MWELSHLGSIDGIILVLIIIPKNQHAAVWAISGKKEEVKKGNIELA